MREVADESRRRTEVAGSASCPNSRTGSGVMAEDAARGRSRQSAAVAGWHRAHHSEVLMRSTAPRIFQPRKNSKIDAHTCPEGGHAIKPGPTHGATEIEPRAPGGQAVQKYRRRAARTDRARSRVGRGYAALAAMPLGPPDVPRPWHGTDVGKVLFLRERGVFFELAGGGLDSKLTVICR
jgi:hypothetical protein